ncbi:MAG TPA: GGDEF domain-containing protein [Dongiaceae bacterium]|nr:GGDEF domain-containing protein [Dongiaceae bacterium]
MSGLILWLEDKFRQQQDSTGCLVMATLPFPLFLLFLVMPWIAQTDPAWHNIYNHDLLSFVQIMLGLVLAGQLVVAAIAWQQRHDGRDLPQLSLFAVVTVFAGVITLSMGYGYKDSPLMLLCLGMVILVRTLFKPAVYKAVFVGMGMLFVCSEIAFWTKAFPYAPLLQTPIFVGEQLTPWWAFWLRVVYSMIAIPMVALFFLFAHLMEREKQMLEQLVRTDSLTGLANRREFMQRFEMELHRHERKGKPLSLLLMDVDHFKRINDSHGHPAGDRVLEGLGALLQSSLRRNVDLAARFGGEEFVVLLPETALAQARAVAENLLRRLEAEGFYSAQGPFQVTMSCGVVQVSGTDDELALRVADENLYAAKQAGRNRVVASMAAQKRELEAVC